MRNLISNHLPFPQDLRVGIDGPNWSGDEADVRIAKTCDDTWNSTSSRKYFNSGRARIQVRVAIKRYERCRFGQRSAGITSPSISGRPELATAGTEQKLPFRC